MQNKWKVAYMFQIDYKYLITVIIGGKLYKINNLPYRFFFVV